MNCPKNGSRSGNLNVSVVIICRRISAGFKDNILGYECGILMNVKKSAFLKKVNINISNCSYDTIFYRVNIYKVRGKMDFENILREPIYLKMPRESVREGVVIDLASKNIVVDSDSLIFRFRGLIMSFFS